VLAAVAAVVLICPLAEAQWLHQPAAGIPRTREGKPDLSAPAPRTNDGKPDLSGRWKRNVRLVDPKSPDRLPWAEAVFEERRESLGLGGKDSPGVMCLPWGPEAITSTTSVKILQTPGVLVMLWEDLTYRQIFLDGRALPRDPNPSWMGYSVARWEGDTLLVNSIGFTDRSWLFQGNPHSEDLRITERYRRLDFGHMDLLVTIDDPKAFARPFTVTLAMDLDPDTEHLEYVCNENEKSRNRMVGRLSDERAREVAVDPGLLDTYVGIYEATRPDRTRFRFDITREGDALFLQRDGRAPIRLTALSSTRFVGLAEYEFVTDAAGVVTHFIFRGVEGENRAIRIK
jgi:hypothetical protein